MPRRRPAAVRLDQEVLALRASYHERIDGLSPHGQRVLDRLELTRRWAGSTASAMRIYRRWMNDPAHRLRDDNYGCGVAECCPNPRDLREWLEVVAHHLPRRDRGTIQTLLNEIDARW